MYGQEFDIPEAQMNNLRKFESNERVSNLLNSGKISYSNAKKMKHDMESDSNLKNELGGDMFYNWINQCLNSKRNSIHLTKKNKSEVLDNQFIRSHEKNHGFSRPSTRHEKTANKHSTRIESYDHQITENLKRINEIMKKII